MNKHEFETLRDEKSKVVRNHFTAMDDSTDDFVKFFFKNMWKSHCELINLYELQVEHLNRRIFELEKEIVFTSQL